MHNPADGLKASGFGQEAGSAITTLVDLTEDQVWFPEFTEQHTTA